MGGTRLLRENAQNYAVDIVKVPFDNHFDIKNVDNFYNPNTKFVEIKRPIN